jgi:DNA-binding PadR family transcriptional regulator
MEPINRFIETTTRGNLWIYVLSLGIEREVQDKEVSGLIFDKFGFLPSELLIKTILFRLKSQGYIKIEKYKGEKAFSTTDKGKEELRKMKKFSEDLLQKL